MHGLGRRVDAVYDAAVSVGKRGTRSARMSSGATVEGAMTALQLALALAVAGEFGFLVGYIASERRVMRRVDRRLRRRGIDQLRERLLPSVQFKDRPLEPRVFDDREPTRATD